jgi:molybdopterin-containing oxidoreductase family membrane subunit
MWLERFVIVITSLHRDWLPSSWGVYYPTQYDWAVFAGTIGFFLTLMFLFVKVLPAISIFEMREVLHHLHMHPHPHGSPAPNPSLSPSHGD